MNNLIFSSLVRLRKNKLFWIGILAIIIYAVVQCTSTYSHMLQYKGDSDFLFDFDGMLFSTLSLLAIVLSIVISMFIGMDYSDGTIRNKIVVGRSRYQIYMAGFIVCFIIGTINYVLGILTTYVVGSPLLGGLHMGMKKIVPLFLFGILMLLAYAAIFNFIVMLNRNKTHGVIISILLAFGMLFLCIYIYQKLAQPEMIEQVSMVGDKIETELVKNPHYVTGVQREIYLFLLDFLPYGQGIQILNLEVAHPVRVVCCDICLAGAFNLVGGILFKRKDLV